jgi:hypothetical protein
LMLASTVQFSRYGRPRDKTRRIRSGQSRSCEDASRPVPSGPNSVLSRSTAAAGVPPPRRGRTSRPCRIGSQLTSAPQVSSHPGTLARDMALGTPPAGDAPGAP